MTDLWRREFTKMGALLPQAEVLAARPSAWSAARENEVVLNLEPTPANPRNSAPHPDPVGIMELFRHKLIKALLAREKILPREEYGFVSLEDSREHVAQYRRHDRPGRKKRRPEPTVRDHVSPDSLWHLSRLRSLSTSLH